MKATICVLSGMLIATIAAPVSGHHSFAMFDSNKAVSMTGIAKEYEWTNPHVWIHMMAPDAQGIPREWSFEMQSVQQDSYAGWRPDSVKPGDRVTVEFHPLKDGSRGRSVDERHACERTSISDRPQTRRWCLDGQMRRRINSNFATEACSSPVNPKIAHLFTNAKRAIYPMPRTICGFLNKPPLVSANRKGSER